MKSWPLTDEQVSTFDTMVSRARQVIRRSDERIVEIPGIVEIRWVSDDPEFYREPIDLFDEQKNGLPDFYGKKDKQTTEQSWFTCIVCECDLKSVVTLRAHCKGTQHIRKALQKKEYFLQ